MSAQGVSAREVSVWGVSAQVVSAWGVSAWEVSVWGVSVWGGLPGGLPDTPSPVNRMNE